MFGDLGHLGYLVQNLAGAEPVIDPVSRLRLNNLVELVQDPEVKANLAIHNLVQVLKQDAVTPLLRWFLLRRISN